MSDRKQLYKQLVEAGVHFGHQKSRWNPNMKPYLWGMKNKIHLIDVSKTAHQLQKAASFLEKIAADGKQILWVGTKKAAQKPIRETAQRLEMPYVDHRWVGGTLSNFSQVKKSVTRLLHDEDIIEKSEQFPHYTKKELNVIKKRAERTAKIVGGIRKFTMPVGALVVVDVGKEGSALREASVMGVPVVGIVDTNCDPSLVDYVIPANDDAEKSIAMITNFLATAIERGHQEAKKTALERKKQEAAKKVEAKEVAAKKAAPRATEEKAVAKKAETKVAKKSDETDKEADKKSAEKTASKKETAKPAAKKTASKAESSKKETTKKTEKKD